MTHLLDVRPDPGDRAPAVKLVVSQQLVKELADGDALRLGAGHGDEATLGGLELPVLLLEDLARFVLVGRLGRGADDAPLEANPVPPEATVLLPVQRALTALHDRPPACCGTSRGSR